jgi:ornithine cyclodeaminase/alanine dehydrogenase-like protein (mu-crystallin family)
MVTAEDLARLAPHGDVVEALREAFGAALCGPAAPSPRHRPRQPAGNATYLLMPAWSDMSGGDAETGFVGLKTVLVVPDNPPGALPTVQATYQLFSGLTGATPGPARRHRTHLAPHRLRLGARGELSGAAEPRAW